VTCALEVSCTCDALYKSTSLLYFTLQTSEIDDDDDADDDAELRMMMMSIPE